MNNCIIYSKKFDSIAEGFKEIAKYVPSIKEYFDITTLEDPNEDNIVNVLIDKLKENICVTSNPNFPYTYGFKCDIHGITFDTDKHFSFGWKVIREDGGKVFYIMRVLFMLHDVRSTSEYNLMNNGWKDFIHKREYKPRKNNDFHKKAVKVEKDEDNGEAAE